MTRAEGKQLTHKATQGTAARMVQRLRLEPGTLEAQPRKSEMYKTRWCGALFLWAWGQGEDCGMVNLSCSSSTGGVDQGQHHSHAVLVCFPRSPPETIKKGP